jgi:CRP-like cAMP-binding protein
MPKPSEKVNCHECGSRSQSLLCSLKSAELTTIDESKFHQHFKAGQNLFYAGNPASGVFCILSGTVKLEVQDDEGKTQIAQVYSKGGMIGYHALFSNDQYMSSAIAVEQTELCFIPKTTILELVKNNPELALKFLKQLSDDFRMMETRLHRVSSNSAVERIAEALLFLRENFQDKNWTRKEISEWASTTTETVIRTLADFETEGLIEQKGRLINILKRDKLLAKARISV